MSDGPITIEQYPNRQRNAWTARPAAHGETGAAVAIVVPTQIILERAHHG